ncbi:hypothetical protein [Streptomyces sp. NBC_01092]|uniref:hypothetical protein n=1 Tax=Streptomyces sp. NBC_01092 TaxID=2903748 RepID=UPI00386D36AF|nr:hypothetical protein OG254_38535 [Streptomyces sp. NBC_01092]
MGQEDQGMGNINRRHGVDAAAFEVFEAQLDVEDLEAIRSDPEKFFRELVAPEIDQVNSVIVGTKVLNDSVGQISVSIFHQIAGSHVSRIIIDQE